MQAVFEMRSVDAAIALMLVFAEETAVGKTFEGKRYLWTDAFAVFNFLKIYELTGENRFRDLALLLIEDVHLVLGSYCTYGSTTSCSAVGTNDQQTKIRGGDNDGHQRLSGLTGQEASSHPTFGGLRIGKKLPERQAEVAYDPYDNMEWERDGQYFHYLTKWAHALRFTTFCLGDARHARVAVELLKGVHHAFVYRNGKNGQPKMFWKMDVSLTRPLVPSMGHHDPLDGQVVAMALTAVATPFHTETADVAPTASISGLTAESGSETTKDSESPQSTVFLKRFERDDLENEIQDFEAMCEGRDFATTDDLGLGGLLMDARVLLDLLMSSTIFAMPQSCHDGSYKQCEREAASKLVHLLRTVLESACRGVRQLEGNRLGDAGIAGFFHQKRASGRLAFREIGLAIGLRQIRFWTAKHELTFFGHSFEWLGHDMEYLFSIRSCLKHFSSLASELADSLVDFWVTPKAQTSSVWKEHKDINVAMLATAILSDF